MAHAKRGFPVLTQPRLQVPKRRYIHGNKQTNKMEFLAFYLQIFYSYIRSIKINLLEAVVPQLLSACSLRPGEIFVATELI